MARPSEVVTWPLAEDKGWLPRRANACPRKKWGSRANPDPRVESGANDTADRRGCHFTRQHGKLRHMSYASKESGLPTWLTDLVSPLDDKLGVKVIELSPERCVIKAPLAGNTQPLGLWHGGGSGVLVETAGSLAAMFFAHQSGKGAVGTELNVSHMRAPKGEHMTATATAMHLGRRTTTHAVEIVDDLGRICAVGRVSCQIIDLD